MMNISADSLEIPPIKYARKIDGVREMRICQYFYDRLEFSWQWDTVIDGVQVHYKIVDPEEDENPFRFADRMRPLAIEKLKEYYNERI